MSVTDGYIEFVRDLLGSFEPLRVKRMFGGAGVYSAEVFFAIVADDALYLKVDDRTRSGVANEKAVTDQKARLQDQLSRLGSLIGNDGLDGTEAVYADETFADRKLMTIGSTRIEIHHAGHAHTPGDSFVWLPDHKILFSGDIVYTDRMLGIGPQSAHRSWIAAFEAVSTKQPEILVGGHGRPADLAKATADTYDYLVFLRDAVQAFMDEGRGMEEIGEIDQSRFGYLENFDGLKGRNAQRVFEELEWE